MANGHLCQSDDIVIIVFSPLTGVSRHGIAFPVSASGWLSVLMLIPIFCLVVCADGNDRPMLHSVDNNDGMLIAKVMMAMIPVIAKIKFL